jgi:hypothetical protein
MSGPESGKSLRSQVTLLICDAAGKVQAVSSGNSAYKLARPEAAQKHFSEVFGRDSQLTDWLTEQFSIARKDAEHYAESRVRNGSGEVMVKLESLRRDSELYGFAVYISSIEEAARPALGEGDAIVTRQQWHDIKNHLGGLKLYATFLKRKLPAGDDQQTVEKMLSGIDGLIDHLAKIRRGEAQ